MKGSMVRPMLIIVGIVMISLALFIFPIVISGAEEVRTHASVAQYTGLSSIVSVAPTLIFVLFLFGGAFSMLAGTGAGGRIYRRLRGRRRAYR